MEGVAARRGYHSSTEQTFDRILSTLLVEMDGVRLRVSCGFFLLSLLLFSCRCCCSSSTLDLLLTPTILPLTTCLSRALLHHAAVGRDSTRVYPPPPAALLPPFPGPSTHTRKRRSILATLRLNSPPFPPPLFQPTFGYFLLLVL